MGSPKLINLVLFGLISTFCLVSFWTEASHKKEEHKEVHILDQQPPTYLCPDGFTLENHLCTLTTSTPLVKSCAAGYMNGTACISYDEPIYTCPKGYIPFQSGYGKGKTNLFFGPAQQCILVEHAQYEESCPEHTTLTAEGCAVEKSVPLVMVCPLDHQKYEKFHSSDCVTYDSVEPLKSCSGNYVLENGVCVGTQTAPCLTPGKTHHHHSHLHHYHHHGHHRSLGKKDDDKKKKDDVEIVATEPYVPVPVSMCDTRVEIQPILTCPKGSTPTSSSKGGHQGHKKYKGESFSCVTATQVPLEPFCSVGQVDASGLHCTPTTSYEPTLKQCPAGYAPCEGKKQQGFSCCSISYASPSPSCDSTSTLENGQCVSTHPFVYSCEPGATQQGDECIQIETAPVKIQYSVRLETTETVEDKKVKTPHLHAHHAHHHHIHNGNHHTGGYHHHHGGYHHG